MSTDRASRFFGHPTYRAPAPGRADEVELYQPRFRKVSPGEISRTVRSGDRLDRLAFELASDPEGFWRLADANRCFDPTTLEEEGRTLLGPRRRE